MIARLHALRAAGAVLSWRCDTSAPLVAVIALRPDGTTLTTEGETFESAVTALVWALEGAKP